LAFSLVWDFAWVRSQSAFCSRPERVSILFRGEKQGGKQPAGKGDRLNPVNWIVPGRSQSRSMSSFQMLKLPPQEQRAFAVGFANPNPTATMTVEKSRTVPFRWISFADTFSRLVKRAHHTGDFRSESGCFKRATSCGHLRRIQIFARGPPGEPPDRLHWPGSPIGRFLSLRSNTPFHDPGLSGPGTDRG